MVIVYRQGDIVLEAVEKLPDNVNLVDLKFSMTGETGQAHVMEDVWTYNSSGRHVAVMDTIKGVLTYKPIQEFVEVGKGGAIMIHPEHPVMPVNPGLYKVRRVRTGHPKKKGQPLTRKEEQHGI